MGPWWEEVGGEAWDLPTSLGFSPASLCVPGPAPASLPPGSHAWFSPVDLDTASILNHVTLNPRPPGAARRLGQVPILIQGRRPKCFND